MKALAARPASHPEQSRREVYEDGSLLMVDCYLIRTTWRGEAVRAVLSCSKAPSSVVEA